MKWNTWLRYILLVYIIYPIGAVRIRFGSVKEEDNTNRNAYSWKSIAVSGSVPQPRQGHSLLNYENNIYLVGGCINDRECTNDVSSYNTTSHTWHNVSKQYTGLPLEPRSGHSTVTIGSNAFITFGASKTKLMDNTVIRLDFKHQQWMRGVPDDNTNLPIPRTNQAAVKGRHGLIYFFGGYDVMNNKYLNDLWVLDSKWDVPYNKTNNSTFPIQWTEIKGSGAVPSGRASHTATYIDDQIFIVCGYDTGNYGIGGTVQDVYRFDIATKTWNFVVPVGDTLIQPRQGHVATRIGTSIFILGGCAVSVNNQDTEICLNDMWSFNTTTSEWIQESTPEQGDAAGWTPREGAAIVEVESNLFVFGGQNSQQTFTDLLEIRLPTANGKLCGLNGTYNVTTHVCQCNSGFAGLDCMEIDECPVQCHNQGDCINQRCHCHNGFFGELCEEAVQCPKNCSGHGQCLPDGTCHCTLGFFGEDCSAGATPCPQDCNHLGLCEQDGTCKCDLGFFGNACEKKETCPLSCCSNGKCSMNTGCTCEKGWYGPACNLKKEAYDMLLSMVNHQKEQFESLAKVKQARLDEEKSLYQFLMHTPNATQQAKKLQQHIDELTFDSQDLLIKANHTSIASLAILDLTTATCPVSHAVKPMTDIEKRLKKKRFFLASMKGTQEKPKADEFGIENLEKSGAVGAIPWKCKDNCNSRGLCQDSICYCQPGHYGKTCDETKMKGPINLTTMGIFVTGSMFISFTITFVMLTYFARQKRKAEREMGYLV